MDRVCIIEGIRTPIGRLGGGLSKVRPDDLAAKVLRVLIERVGIQAKEVEDVILGCTNQAGEDNRNVARMSLLLAGIPYQVAGSTVNRLCGSGLEAVAQAARTVTVGDGTVCIAGGVESMSRAPWVVAKPDRAFPRGNVQMFDSVIGWRFPNPAMERAYGIDSLGVTAENLAVQYRISREEQDYFALGSHQKAVSAASEGFFSNEIVPVGSGDELLEHDESPRADTSQSKLADLPPAFLEGGTVTAGNSSPLNDGAAALLLTSHRYARSHGLRCRASIKSVAVEGVEPRIMGIGPVPATEKALKRAGLALEDMDLIELNEAFAAQALAVMHDWGLDMDNTRINVNGGAIALGHPVGCSGARIVVTLIHEMERRDAEHGLATMCIGVGQGIAMVVERCDAS
jgi:acetyl-CoA acyltransferase